METKAIPPGASRYTLPKNSGMDRRSVGYGVSKHNRPYYILYLSSSVGPEHWIPLNLAQMHAVIKRTSIVLHSSQPEVPQLDCYTEGAQCNGIKIALS
jgi:hypothetical protein